MTAVGATPSARMASTVASAPTGFPARANPSTMAVYVCAFGAHPASRISRTHPLASSARPARANACTIAVYARTVGLDAGSFARIPARSAFSARSNSPHRAYA